MLESEEYSAVEEAMDSSYNNNDNKRKRRFSDDQIKSLECMFESQTKLETRKKLQLARELGLQPRQVAIWFQNKRARWKSKQLEREYSALRADYDALLSSFESVKKEKQSLLKQLQKLTDLLEKPQEGNGDGGESDNGDTSRKPSSRSSTEGTDLRLMVCSGGEKKVTADDNGYSEKQQTVLRCMGEPADGSSVLADQQKCYFDTGGGCFSDQSCSDSSQWWEFWPLNE